MSNLLLNANIDNTLIEQVKHIMGIEDKKNCNKKGITIFC